MPKATANRAVEAVVQTIIDALEAGDVIVTTRPRKRPKPT